MVLESSGASLGPSSGCQDTGPQEQSGHRPTQSIIPVSTAFDRILGPLGRPSSDGPDLETVSFSEADEADLLKQPVTHQRPATPPPSSAPFVTLQRGSSPIAMQEGHIPSTPAEFDSLVTGQVQPPVCDAPRRRRARIAAPPHSPRRSVRLAMKSRRRTPALLAAQNVLLKKLGLTAEAPPEADDIVAYIHTFQNGHTEDQARLIDELFIDYVPAAVEAEADEAEP